MAKIEDPEAELKIEWLPCDRLTIVWPEAQRQFFKARAKKIADNFNWKRFDPVRVTLPNGKFIFHIIEGQTRTAAAAMKFGPSSKVPCIRFPETNSPQEAAKDFRGVNELRWPVSPVQSFRVRVTEKEPIAVAVDKIVRQRGYKVGNAREGITRYISAVSALIEVFTTNGPKILSDVLQVLSATWPADPMATHGHILRGYGMFLGEYTNANWGHLKTAIPKKFTPGSLLAAAKPVQELNGGTLPRAVVNVLFSTYNKGLKDDKKLKKKV